MNKELNGNLKNPNDSSLEKVDVIVIFKKNNPVVYKLKYNNVDYKIEKTGIHYTQKIGENLYHIFGVISKGTFFKIAFDTTTLNWKLLESGYEND